MPSEVRHLVDRDQSFPLVRLTGVLDTETAAPVRATLLDVLAGQPEAVVVDVAGLRVRQGDALSVLREVLDETRDWPAARLALCCIGDADGNGAAWTATGWPIWADQASAFAALGPADSGRRVSLELEPFVGAARRARELITETCLRWELAEVAGDACIVATEMVNNVVAHAHTAMRLLLARHGDTVSVAVRDGSPVLPDFTGPVAPTAYGGRGLLLIDAVSERWGRLALTGGKVVWARLKP
ncbi:sulfate transporter [Actinoplanes ianthinogenes]|uniref:Sulfate transporter n=1 Tax=Actinoplanes ianthinogenes TaxID=122358 RepID=A0ABM7LU39_9ACTN|nr:ATP-binding protein [Actinoplanes ianthinogenes]BCJ42757.1 sulfate transporter [Actinoplanes ianthinogenes]GGQ92404.1 sulfate transporter [Actinoplanes ianthinogenes]